MSTGEPTGTDMPRLAPDVPAPGSRSDWPINLSAPGFDDQATFHPRLYLQALAEAFVAGGGAIHEETPVVDVQDGRPCRVLSDRGVVTASAVIVAAHVPITNRFFLHRLRARRGGRLI